MDWILFDSLVLHSIPTVGPTSPLLSYFGAIRLLFDSERMLQEGYEKHRHGLFKVADFTSWTVMVSGPQLISDVRKAPADVLEFEAAIDDAVHALGPSIRRSQFHVPLIRIQLTRETNPSFYDIRDEITTGFTDLIPATTNHLRPLVEERQKNIKLYGRDYAGKPQDLLSWLIDEVDGQTDKEKLTHLAFHMLIVNFGANSTIAMKSFVQALYHLASHPEYVGPLREEVESITTNEGWTKDAMRSLHRLENFLKESQRVSGLAAVRKPFVFSNGVRIPAGVTIGVATWPTHFDDEVYPNAHTFDASRYKDDESRIVTPSDEFLAFGVGRFMCPGRFFGVLILQVMMAHVLMNYDVRLETEGERPKDSWFATEFIPDTSADRMFERGQDKLYRISYPAVILGYHNSGRRLLVSVIKLAVEKIMELILIQFSGAQLIEDIRKAPEHVLSFEAAIDEAIHALGPKTRRSHFHVPIIQTQLTRELTNSFDEIRDEVMTAFSELVPPTEEWSKSPALATTLEVVSQTAHRVFVGLPLCRDPGYISLNKNWATEISKAAWVIRLFPPSLKPLVGRPFVDAPKAIKGCAEYIRPLLEERREKMEMYGQDYPGKPQDLLTWFMDNVDGDTDEEKLRHVAFHLMMVDFGAVYTISTDVPLMQSFVQALYHLAAHPECIDPLRQELESVTASEGWTRAAMGDLRKLDSFLKESQRISGLGASTFAPLGLHSPKIPQAHSPAPNPVSSYRRVLKPFTFSNGVTVPAGMTIGVAAWSTHLDEAIYANANEFDGFRYTEKSSDASSAQMVSPSTDFLAFGVGRHMW
ncbi:hypothetical protein H0H92_004093 [Tricholoma furcatifolium]|nr:hypothetical protein H0H92_004093 [Tricholoma furcatifolium]